MWILFIGKIFGLVGIGPGELYADGVRIIIGNLWCNVSNEDWNKLTTRSLSGDLAGCKKFGKVAGFGES
jgi:hypothetical protein